MDIHHHGIGKINIWLLDQDHGMDIYNEFIDNLQNIKLSYKIKKAESEKIKINNNKIKINNMNISSSYHQPQTQHHIGPQNNDYYPSSHGFMNVGPPNNTSPTSAISCSTSSLPPIPQHLFQKGGGSVTSTPTTTSPNNNYIAPPYVAHNNIHQPPQIPPTEYDYSKYHLQTSHQINNHQQHINCPTPPLQITTKNYNTSLQQQQLHLQYQVFIHHKVIINNNNRILQHLKLHYHQIIIIQYHHMITVINNNIMQQYLLHLDIIVIICIINQH